jgi:hypothetical protein
MPAVQSPNNDVRYSAAGDVEAHAERHDRRRELTSAL